MQLLAPIKALPPHSPAWPSCPRPCSKETLAEEEEASRKSGPHSPVPTTTCRKCYPKAAGEILPTIPLIIRTIPSTSPTIPSASRKTKSALERIYLLTEAFWTEVRAVAAKSSLVEEDQWLAIRDSIALNRKRTSWDFFLRLAGAVLVAVAAAVVVAAAGAEAEVGAEAEIEVVAAVAAAA